MRAGQTETINHNPLPFSVPVLHVGWIPNLLLLILKVLGFWQ